MKVVSTGIQYHIYDDTMRVYDFLPSQVYQVMFSKNSGFFLSKHDDIVVGEKLYGDHMEKAAKVLDAFRVFTRNLGVILSGDKGIGKSLFAKVLSQMAVERQIPVIIVNTAYPGIGDYIASIQQEVLFIFDEFDKVFKSGDDYDPQGDLLTVFDGMTCGKKLFVITCNDISKINSCLVNRPGRFHYHFRFDYPADDAIVEYLTDKLDAAFHGEIQNVVCFAHKIPLTYDCLRAIAFELSMGRCFKDAIRDLNILRTENRTYELTVVFKDGDCARRTYRMDMFDNDIIAPEFQMYGTYDFYVRFYAADAIVSQDTGLLIVPGDKLMLDWEENYYDQESDAAALAERKLKKAAYMSIEAVGSRSVNYKI